MRQAMAAVLPLPPLPRETLLSAAERVARLEQALPVILATVEGETDGVALQATLACMLWETLVQANWCGFYRRVGESTLAVGPYQGTLGCLRIEFSRGVCGAAARTGQTQLVADVHAFPDHIACDSRSRSEVVVPVFHEGRLCAVLDIDSPHEAGFSAGEAALLERLVEAVFDRAGINP
jgi:L-methionine (R)-S-oxide reductase